MKSMVNINAIVGMIARKTCHSRYEEECCSSCRYPCMVCCSMRNGMVVLRRKYWSILIIILVIVFNLVLDFIIKGDISIKEYIKLICTLLLAFGIGKLYSDTKINLKADFLTTEQTKLGRLLAECFFKYIWIQLLLYFFGCI